MSNVNHQPIPTLYVNNIESKVKKDGKSLLLLANPYGALGLTYIHFPMRTELRRQLYALFVPYGKMLVPLYHHLQHKRITQSVKLTLCNSPSAFIMIE
jgi:hypothetical protein